MPYTYEYPRPAVTVDAAVFRIYNNEPQILLIKRANAPFQGMWAIPGGFIEMDETLDKAAKRELEEETGLKDISLKQYGVYGEPNRDPRHRTISIAFAGILPDNKITAKAADDAAEFHWFHVDHLPVLAFDHSLIIADAIAFSKQQCWI